MGSPSTKIFPRSEHVSSQIWCQKIFPLLRPGNYPPPQSKTGNPPWPGPGTPLDLGAPPDLDLGPPPPQRVNRQTFPSINITFPRTTYAGGNKLSLTLDWWYLNSWVWTSWPVNLTREGLCKNYEENLRTQAWKDLQLYYHCTHFLQCSDWTTNHNHI